MDGLADSRLVIDEMLFFFFFCWGGVFLVLLPGVAPGPVFF